MRNSPFTAVYDACVLYPAPLRDFLIRCHASVIVTFHQKDFPAEVLASFGIEAQHPDEFIENLFDLDPATVVEAARRQRQQLKNPPMDVERYLDVLLKQGLTQTVKSLTAFRGVL